MKSTAILSILCMTLCLGAVSCRSTAAADAEAVGISEVLEIDGCTLPEPFVQVTPDVLETLPEPVRTEAKKHCGKPGIIVVASSLRPVYFRLIRRQNRLVLGSEEKKALKDAVYLSVIAGLGEAADTIRSIKLEKPDAPDPWDIGIFIKRYPELADRISELPPDDERLDGLRPAARELLSRGSTRVMLERHSRTKAPEALESAAQAEKEQIAVLEELLNAK